jgi:hypothetical protein
MTPDINKFRNELAKSNNHETGFLRGCIADLIKDKADRNLLNICLNAGVLQDFFHETFPDTFLIRRFKKKLIEEFYISEAGADKAISFCKFLTSEETGLELIPYRKGKKWGFATKDKYIQIECLYDFVDLFKNEMAIVHKDRNVFCIDRNGLHIKQLDNFISESLNYFESTYSIDCKGNSFYWNVKMQESRFSWGIIKNFIEGIASRIRGDSLGFIDNGGNLIIPEIYETDYYNNHQEFSEGLVSVKKDGKWGYINKNGDVRIPFTYDFAEKFKNGIARIKFNGMTGFIDKEDNLITPLYQEEDFDDEYGEDFNFKFSEGLLNVRKDDQWGYVNELGKLVVPFKYDAAMHFHNSIAAVSKKGKWGLIDKNGKTVIPFLYQQIRRSHDSTISAKLNNNWGLIDQQGNTIIPFKYDNLRWFQAGFAIANKNHRFGIVSQTGETTMPFGISQIRYPHYKQEANIGLIPVLMNDKWGFVDLDGNIAVPCIYDVVNSFSSGLAAVCYNGKCGYINMKGETVIPYKYFEIHDFDKNLALVIDDSGTKGYINLAGTEFWED